METGSIMEKLDIAQKINFLIDEFCQLVQKKLERYSEGLMLIGSCARGDISLSRPDIGFFLLLKDNASHNVFLTLGEIVTFLSKKYRKELCLRPEFRPFKTSYPIFRGGLDIWLSGSIAKTSEGSRDFPFGVPKTVLAGMKQARKIIFGRDFLAHVDTHIDKNYIFQIARRDIGIYKLQLSLAPLVYNLDQDFGLLFDEAVSLGKQAARNGVWIASTDKEIKKGDHLKYFTDFGKMIFFFKRRYNQEASKSVRFILEARDNFPTWKREKRKAYLMFRETSKFLEIIWSKLRSNSSE